MPNPPPVDLEDIGYRAFLLRPKGVTPHVDASVGDVVTSIEWRYEEGNPTLMGTLSLLPLHQWDGQRVKEGDTLRLDARWFGQWRELWRMQLRDPADQLATGVSFDLADPMIVLQESLDDWHFVKSKHDHPDGWRCDEILTEVARRYRVPVGRVVKGARRIHSLVMDDASPMQVIQRAYALEKSATGHRFVIRWVNGRLTVAPMRQNPLLYVLREQIEDGLLGKEDRGDDFMTAGTVRATVKRGKGKPHKIVVSAQDDAAVRKYGFVHKNVEVGDVKDEADAREKLLRKINKVSKRKRTLTGLTHPALPFIRRGDALHASIPSRGLTGDSAVCWVSAGTWTLSGGLAEMSLDMTYDDPYATSSKAVRDQDKQARAAKA